VRLQQVEIQQFVRRSIVSYRNAVILFVGEKIETGRNYVTIEEETTYERGGIDADGTDLEPEDGRRLGMHPTRDPWLDERARPTREVVEGGRPHPAGQRRRLPPGQSSARTPDRRRRCCLHAQFQKCRCLVVAPRGTGGTEKGRDLRATESGGMGSLGP
jgi:hypothetical protein